eukprot:jgi/Psemu1/282702/fgenesh1_pg.12_\
MVVGAECKEEDIGNGEKSSSAVDDAKSISPATAITTTTTLTAGESIVHHPQTTSVDKSSIDTCAAIEQSPGLNRTIGTSASTEPQSKRIKLEDGAATSITTEWIGGAIATTELADVVKEASTSTTTALSVSVPQSSSPLVSSIKPDVVTESAPTGHDSSTTSAAAVTGVGNTTQPQHAPTPTTASVLPQQKQQEVTRSVPVKDEVCSSTNSQGGPPSVVTASDESCPQHTSHSDNASGNSSNESLQESTTIPATATPESSTSSAASSTGLPNASTVAVAPSTATTVRPVGSIPPQTQPCHAPTSSGLKAPSPATTIPPPAKPPPARTLVPPSSATSSTPISHTTTTAPNSREVPLKSLNFVHLRIKYLGELEYMLREFRKLERQLLGAKGAQQLEESQGSRERREKLHSFILHLEDTIRQIEHGCKVEEEGKSATAENTDAAKNNSGTDNTNNGDASISATIVSAEAKKQLAEESALSNLTKEKEEEETVQKLEEHILANLLPVKVRLKKQLAAQQGATQNPPGMPARRGSLQPSSTVRGKGTFVEAVEKKRKHAESLRLAAQAQHERQARSVTDPSQFGKPLRGVGSSLTKKLHGSTLGSSQRRTGHGVGSSAPVKDGQERKILHAGMVPKSTQQESGLSAASGVHEITEPTPATAAPQSNSSSAKQAKPVVNSSSAPTSEEDRLRFKKQRRLRKLKRLKRRRERELARQQQSKTQQQIPSSSQPAPSTNVVRKKTGHSKAGQKKKGPRVVEYTCSQCSEAYSSTCDYNPWWALAQHKCPKCQKTQIPRIDISSPANAIEYHPALLSHLEDGGRGSGGSIPQNGAQPVIPAMPIVSQIPDGANDVNSESDSDLSELSDDNISIGSLKAAELESDLQSMTPAERAEHETFGSEYEGPVLSDEHAAKLLILIGHAATCPCQHKSEKHRDVCRSVKYMMLHVRDCPGTTSTFDVCPFPWCRKVKHLLYHLVSCTKPDQCAICSPKDIPKGLKGLVGLNAHRMKKHRERMIAAAKAMTAKSTKPNAATKKTNTKTSPATPISKISSTKISTGDPSAAVSKPVTTPAQVPAQPLVAPNAAVVKTNVPYTSAAANALSVETGITNTTCVQNSVATKPHPVLAKPVADPVGNSITIPVANPVAQVVTQPTTQPIPQARIVSNDLPKPLSISDFDLENLDDAHIGSDVADVAEALQTPIVAVKEDNETGTAMAMTIADVPQKATIHTVQYANMASTESATAEILPTPETAIKMEDNDGDDEVLRDLLANSDPAEVPTHSDSMIFMEHDYPAEHIDTISGIPGVDTLNDPDSDPLANINHEMLIDSSDVSPSILIPVPSPTETNTCVSLKEEYSETPASTSVQATSSVSTCPTAAAT